MPHAYFALFSLILPFGMPLAMDNLLLYETRLALEQQTQQERSQIRADLHDMVKNNLASIRAAAEFDLTHPDRNCTSVKQRLQSIFDLTTETNERITRFLMIINDDQPSWAVFCADLRSWRRDWIAGLGLDFDLVITNTFAKIGRSKAAPLHVE